MKTTLLNLAFLFIAQISFCNNQPPPYISAFKDLAIQEMERTGIPASITLAQGIIESAWGKGVLARSSNNHFGIKCKSNWNGDAYLLEDDDYDQSGNLIKSCFRAYEDATTSYIDHSNFLKNGARYAALFELNPTDYVSWAHGLQAAGYATDPAYAEKLIAKIEMYELYKYDQRNFAPIEPVESLEEILEAPSYIIPQELEIKTEQASNEVIPNHPIEDQNFTPSVKDDSEIEPKEKAKVRMTMHSAFPEIR